MTNRITVKYQGEKPHHGSELAAGYDIKADGTYIINPGESAAVKSKTALQPPPDYMHLAMPRSSLCNKNGLLLMNSVGLIDPDYTGVTVWNFWNLSNTTVTIKDGERIGQVVFIKRTEVDFVEDPFEETERGSSGFGSTGTH